VSREASWATKTAPTFTGVKSGIPCERELRIAHKGLSDGVVLAPSKGPRFELPKTNVGVPSNQIRRGHGGAMIVFGRDMVKNLEFF